MSRIATLLSVLLLALATLAAGLALKEPSSGGSRSVTARIAAPGVRPASFRPVKATDRPPADSTEPPAPIRLTASDGTGLSLVSLEANGLLEPPLAFTELHLTFENPGDRRIEGRFRIALPPAAALSRFAMKVGDAWQEGEVVERQRARVAYEDVLHRRQDPALLEQEAGNEFSARVFPIPARGRKELIVSYSHALARADEPYVIPLHGLSQVGALDVRVLLGSRPAAGVAASNLGGEVTDRRVVELHKRDWVPDRDFRIVPARHPGEPADFEIGEDRLAGRAGLRDGNLAVFRIPAPVETVPEEIDGLYVLVDSSASRTLGYASQVRRLAELIGALRDGAGGATPVGIAAFDQEVVPIFEGRAGDFGPAEVERLASRRPLGASDLHRALTWLAERLARNGPKYPRVLLVSDGVATAGETETRALKAAVHALGGGGVERLDALAAGGLRDDAALREMTTGNLAHDGQRIDGAAPLSEVTRRLTLACRSGIEVSVKGAAWVWPETLDAVQPGDEALVYADLPADRPLLLALGGRPVALGALAAVERPLLERAWVQARIERLLHLRESALAGDDDLRRALGLEIAELSVKHRVLSPFTAMLVLEGDADFARFGLDRQALADILTVGPGGLAVLARTRAASPRVASNLEKAATANPVRPAPGIAGWVEEPKIVGRSEGGVAGQAARMAPEGAEGDLPEVTEAVAGDVADGLAAGSPGGPAAGDLGSVAGGRGAGSVAGGVSGSVAGGVAGGVIGGVPAAPRAAPPSPPAASRPHPAEHGAAADAQLQAATETSGAAGRQADQEREERRYAAPYSGRFAAVMEQLAAGRLAAARALAESWSAEAPGDVLALLALGEVWEAAGEKAAAARAYGSLIDLFPHRADMRRLAGERLERLGEPGLELAIDTYRKAVQDRPDHPTGHRLLAWALLRAGRFAAAFAALEKGVEQHYPAGRFAGLEQVLREDLGLLAAAWLRAEPDRRAEVLDRLRVHGARIESAPSLRFVLTWETDANDVDLHVYDRRGGHAYYREPELPSGGKLYADVTTGYGPECFAVQTPAGGDAAPYRLRVHYYSRGPMGYGMGTVQVVRHDGAGRLAIEPRPFVVMADDAMVDLGPVRLPPMAGGPPW